MPRRDLHNVWLAVAGLLALALIGSSAWLMWYDSRHGHGTAEPAAEFGLPDGISGRDVEADMRRTERAVQPDGFLGTVLARFQLRANRYPASLDELFERPADLPPSRWDGPYLGSADVLQDPWQRPYRYVCPGARNQDSYDLWSVGPDGVDGSGDDIGNW